MNGKRAKALNRFRAGEATFDDIQRLRRTETRQGETEPKPQHQRAKKRTDVLHPLARAARRALR